MKPALGDAVERWVAAILRCSPGALRASKATVCRSRGEPPLAAAMAAQPQYPEFRAWLESADRVEGPTAFAQKRPPVWRD